MAIQYTTGGVELPYPVKFPYPVNVQEFLRDFIIGLPYPVKFPYPVKVSIRKSTYLFKSNNHQPQKSSGLNDF